MRVAKDNGREAEKLDEGEPDEEKEAEAVFSDIISKRLKIQCDQEEVTGTDNKEVSMTADPSDVMIVSIPWRNDRLLSEKTAALKDFVPHIPPFERCDLIELLTSGFRKRPNFGSRYFYVKTNYKLHKVLFSLWIEMLTGIDIKKSFGLNRDILFELGTNYRFPISSLRLISTKNMIKSLSRAAGLILSGLILVTENLESKAIALLLSVSVPRTKGYILRKGSDDFLLRI